MTFRKTAGNFVFNIAKKAFKKDSTPEVIDKVSISKNLKKFQKHKDEIIKKLISILKVQKLKKIKLSLENLSAPLLENFLN